MSFATCWRRSRASDASHAEDLGLWQAWACARPERTAQDVVWVRAVPLGSSQLSLSLLVFYTCTPPQSVRISNVL